MGKKIKETAEKFNVILNAKIEYTYKWVYDNSNQYIPMFYATVIFWFKEPNDELLAFLVSRNEKIWVRSDENKDYSEEKYYEDNKIAVLTINPEEISSKVKSNAMAEIQNIIKLVEEFIALDNFAKDNIPTNETIRITI